MKHLTIAFCVFILIACKKDDSKTETSVIGIWKSSSFIMCDENSTGEPLPYDLNDDGIKNTDFTKEIKGCYEYTFDFMANGNFHLEIKSSPMDNMSGEYDINRCDTQYLKGTWETNTNSTMLYINFTEGFDGSISERWNRFKETINSKIELKDKELVIQNFPHEYYDDFLFKLTFTKD